MLHLRCGVELMPIQQMLLGSGSALPKLGEAVFMTGFFDFYNQRSFTFTFPSGYDKWIAVVVSAGGGAGTLGGGGGGGLLYSKIPYNVADTPTIYVETGGRGQGKHNTAGVDGGHSSIQVTNPQGAYIMLARSGLKGEHNPSGNSTNTWRSSGQFYHAYTATRTLNATNFGGHGGGGSAATAGGGSINAGGGGAGGWCATGNTGVSLQSGRGAGNNGSFQSGRDGEEGGGGGGAGNAGGSNDPGGGGGGGVNIYPTAGYQSGKVGTWGANGDGYTGGFGGANSTSHQGSGSSSAGSGAGSAQQVANGGGTTVTYPSGGGTYYYGKNGQDATTSESGDGGFPGGGSGAGNRAGNAGDGGGGAVRILFWNNSYEGANGAPAWPTTRTQASDITEEHFLNNVRHAV